MWPDFGRSFRAILGTCDAAIEIVRIRNAMPEAAKKFNLGVIDPAESWTMLDRQFSNSDVTIAITITGLIALKIPKGAGRARAGGGSATRHALSPGVPKGDSS